MSGGMSLSCSSRHTSWGEGEFPAISFLRFWIFFPAISFGSFSRQIFSSRFPPNLLLRWIFGGKVASRRIISSTHPRPPHPQHWMTIIAMRLDADVPTKLGVQNQ